MTSSGFWQRDICSGIWCGHSNYVISLEGPASFFFWSHFWRAGVCLFCIKHSSAMCHLACAQPDDMQMQVIMPSGAQFAGKPCLASTRRQIMKPSCKTTRCHGNLSFWTGNAWSHGTGLLRMDAGRISDTSRSIHRFRPSFTSFFSRRTASCVSKKSAKSSLNLWR